MAQKLSVTPAQLQAAQAALPHDFPFLKKPEKRCIQLDRLAEYGCIESGLLKGAAPRLTHISLLGRIHHQAVPVVQPCLLHTRPKKRWYRTSCRALLHGVTLHLQAMHFAHFVQNKTSSKQAARNASKQASQQGSCDCCEGLCKAQQRHHAAA